MFDKSKFNFIINALMFLCMMGMGGIGFLMKFVLIPGKERWVKYGRNVDLNLLGLDRHEWGTIHLIIGFTLLGLLVLHIVLHWKVILSIYNKLISRQMTRRIIAPIFIVLSVIFIAFSFFVKPELREVGQGGGHQGAGCGYVGETERAAKHIEKSLQEVSFEVRGYMTLIEVADKCNISIECLKKHLNIPQSASNEEKLGWLRKKYGFRMSDVERIIAEFHNKSYR